MPGPVPLPSLLQKEIDQQNPMDYARILERRFLMEEISRQMREHGKADHQLEERLLALTKQGTDRILVILVEFAGTDTFTFTPGQSMWDPYGKSDSSEYTGISADLGTPAACNNIISKYGITGPRSFTYSGPRHNLIERPRSATDTSGASIWTQDFNPAYYESIILGNGYAFNYTRQDGSVVNESFIGKSVNNYYNDLSGNLYFINGQVTAWVTVPHSIWWYGADPCPGARSGASVSNSGGIPNAGSARSLVIDAVNAVRDSYPSFNWGQYDQNGDGVIDRLWIIHAGFGEEDATTLLDRTDYGEAALWSHSSSVSPAYEVVTGIKVGAYVMMPENSGIGVLAHEFAHNLGAKDLYAYDAGETSAGFWTLMADDWVGYPLGYQPGSIDPWHLDNWGWLNPLLISDPTQVYNVTIAQTSNFPGGSNVYRGVKILLPDGHRPLAVRPSSGSFQWWGGKVDLTNSMMSLNNPISIPASGADLIFKLAYNIETGWDFFWVQASDNGGTTWRTLTNSHTVCAHDSGWIGGSWFPSDLCGAGIGGFSGTSSNFPAYVTETFSLNSFSGKNILLRFWYMTDWGTLYDGPFIDDIQVTSGGNSVFTDNAESGDGNWNYAGAWTRNDGTLAFNHNYYLQWRNVGSTGGYDSSLGDPRWRGGPSNTGLLVWYNNNYYTDNEVYRYLFDYPGFGPKGLMLVFDAHPDPYRDPYYVGLGYNNEGGNVSHRTLMRDAPFSLNNSVDFTMYQPYVFNTTAFKGLPAVSQFSDALGYYPGAEYVSRGPGYNPLQYIWATKQWDASAVPASKVAVGIKAPGYPANEPLRFLCSRYSGGTLGCYYTGANVGLGYNGGTGNPFDVAGQYGWNVKILSQTDSTATLRIWNSLYTNGGLPQVNMSIGRGGAGTTSTIGSTGVVKAGYTTVTFPPGNPPYGTAVFSYTQNGVVVSEAAVPVSVPTTHARFFIDFRSNVSAKDVHEEAGILNVNTGFAAVNTSSSPANVIFRLYDANKTLLAEGNGPMAAGSHVAKFINEVVTLAPNFHLPSDFSTATQYASLEIESNQPLSIVALRLTINQRGDLLLTSTPIADLTQGTSTSPLFFPQLVDGGGFKTTFILMNTSNTLETGTLKLLKNDGTPLSVRPVNGTTTSQLPYSIPAGGFTVIQTDGSPGTVNAGSVQLIPSAGNSTPVGAGIFSYTQAGILVTESGIPSATPTSLARVYVDKSGGHDTGIAIAAPDGTPVHATVTAYRTDGLTSVGSGIVDLSGNGHMAAFAGEMITTSVLPDGFTGVLEIGSSTLFVALTLRSLSNARGDFLLTTFPIADLTRSAPVPLVFPQIADGGGFQTQFIFISTVNASSITLNYYGDDGATIAVGKRAEEKPEGNR
jgi:immune inhibitor A